MLGDNTNCSVITIARFGVHSAKVLRLVVLNTIEFIDLLDQFTVHNGFEGNASSAGLVSNQKF